MYGRQTFTSYKAEEVGKKTMFVEARNTSVECWRCGTKVQKELSEITHNCPNCGLVINRHLNAALNILKRVGWGTPEFTPVEIEPLPARASLVKEAGSPDLG
jgi:transposase